MPSNQPSKSGTAFEYFLYAAILAETGLAALIYKVLFRNDDLAHIRVYFAILYFGFLAWAIAQLNRLHRRRKSLVAESTPEAPPGSEQTVPSPRPLLGLTGEQLVTVVLIFATAVAAFSWLLRVLG
jgi:hypothetical protein